MFGESSNGGCLLAGRQGSIHWLCGIACVVLLYPIEADQLHSEVNTVSLVVLQMIAVSSITHFTLQSRPADGRHDGPVGFKEFRTR